MAWSWGFLFLFCLVSKYLFAFGFESFINQEKWSVEVKCIVVEAIRHSFFAFYVLEFPVSRRVRRQRQLQALMWWYAFGFIIYFCCVFGKDRIVCARSFGGHILAECQCWGWGFKSLPLPAITWYLFTCFLHELFSWTHFELRHIIHLVYKILGHTHARNAIIYTEVVI